MIHEVIITARVEIAEAAKYAAKRSFFEKSSGRKVLIFFAQQLWDRYKAKLAFPRKEKKRP